MKNTVHHSFWRGSRLGLVLAFYISTRSGLADTPPAQTFTEPQSPPVRIACVGDSITYGAGLSDRAHDSYPADLGRWLGPGWDVRNYGVSGATSLKKGDLPYCNQEAHTEALAFKPQHRCHHAGHQRQQTSRRRQPRRR